MARWRRRWTLKSKQCAAPKHSNETIINTFYEHTLDTKRPVDLRALHQWIIKEKHSEWEGEREIEGRQTTSVDSMNELPYYFIFEANKTKRSSFGSCEREWMFGVHLKSHDFYSSMNRTSNTSFLSQMSGVAVCVRVCGEIHELMSGLFSFWGVHMMAVKISRLTWDKLSVMCLQKLTLLADANF